MNIILQTDWINVNNMLGAKRNVDIPNEGSHEGRVNSGSTLPVRNNLTPKSRKVLCQFLTNEIRIYIDLLNRAVNLSDDDVRAELEGVETSCPSVMEHLKEEINNNYTIKR